MFGNPETTTGGNALKFYATIRMDIRKSSSIKDGDNVVGTRTRVKIVKNKVSPPFKEVEFDIIYGQGISKVSEILESGVNAGVIEKSGSWFAYNGEKIGQGKDSVAEYLKNNPKVAMEIENKILTHHGVKINDTPRTTTSTAKGSDEKTTTTTTKSAGKRAHTDEAKTN